MEGPPCENKMITEPLLGTTPKGGFRTLPFIIVNEAFEKVASYGLTPNLILYLTREYHMSTAAAANHLFLWTAATNFTPLLGAFLADSFVGRYHIIGFGSNFSLLGMSLLWLTTMTPKARPPFCDQLSANCELATIPQLLLLYASFVFISIGAGGIRSSSLAFGADQLTKGKSLDETGVLETFFNWYSVAATGSVFVALTGVVYIQDHLGWMVGFGVPLVLMFLSSLSFYMASPYYVKSKANTSWLTGFAQVIVASYRNRHAHLPSQATSAMYYHIKGSLLLVPTDKLRFLNKACIIINSQEDLTSDGKASNPWTLCTVDQVEDLKSLIKVTPLWSTGIIKSIALSQGSILVLIARSMDRHITPSFEIPAGSFSMFTVLSLTIWIALYDRLILPSAAKIRGKPVRLGVKQRMGIGIVFSCASMASWAIVERIRKKIAIQEGISSDPQAVVHMSAMWLLPPLVFGGLGEAFNSIGQNEFYYSELPKSISSIASTLCLVAISMGNLVASFIMSTVDKMTKSGGESWVAGNVNKGHYDYYFWLLAGLGLTNFVYFVACAKAYGPCKGEDIQVDGDEITDD